MSALVLGLLLHAARVVAVVDGDTLHVALVTGGEERIRLLGIDCPESRRNQKCEREGSCADVPRGLEAKARARELAPVGSVVLVVDGRKRDRYGRLLAYVFADGRDVGLTLLGAGLCPDVAAKYPHQRQAAYRAAAPNASGDANGVSVGSP